MLSSGQSKKRSEPLTLKTKKWQINCKCLAQEYTRGCQEYTLAPEPLSMLLINSNKNDSDNDVA